MDKELNNLSPLALRVVALRVGADGAGPRTRGQVAQELGCHPRFVERIEALAVAEIGTAGWNALQQHADVQPGADSQP